nr:hypothetical protein CFP56_05360 [Quercus suber]
MEADFIDRMQQIQLTEEEGEVLEIQSTNRDKTLEECSLSLEGILDLNRGGGAQILRLDLRVSSGAEPEPPLALAASRRALVKVRMEESSSLEFQHLRLRGLRRRNQCGRWGLG